MTRKRFVMLLPILWLFTFFQSVLLKYLLTSEGAVVVQKPCFELKTQQNLWPQHFDPLQKGFLTMV